MSDPLINLVAVFAGGLLAVVLFWPARGWFWSWRRALRASGRVLVEDALKHAFDCEYQQNPCTLHSLSGALGISGNRTAEVVAGLERRELLELHGSTYRLTPEGRSYALRVIRTHRLWERYLSDETGLDPAGWHERAEELEHTTTPEEAEALAARMGHPMYDPHGDPIPTVAGEIAPPRGVSLTELPIGELAEIVHVEDEPETVYSQLLAEGLHPGMRVRVLESSPQRVRFEANAEETILGPMLAANLSVVLLSKEAEMIGPFERLSALAVGESAKVVGFAAGCRGPERRRMLDLGLIPGTVVSAAIRSPGGDPTGYRIRGAVIALRAEQADLIRIERPAAGAA